MSGWSRMSDCGVKRKEYGMARHEIFLDDTKALCRIEQAAELLVAMQHLVIGLSSLHFGQLRFFKLRNIPIVKSGRGDQNCICIT